MCALFIFIWMNFAVNFFLRIICIKRGKKGKINWKVIKGYFKHFFFKYLCYVLEPEEANIATRPGSMIKTKGAVAICFMFFGTSILFVNSHLTGNF